MKSLNSISALALAPIFYDSYLLKDSLNKDVGNSSRLEQQLLQYPAVNIQSDDEGFILEIAAPGLHKAYLKIQFEQDKLTVAYQQPEDESSNKSHYSLREFAPRSFSRSFSFKKQLIDDEKIEAAYQDGILRLTLPKREEAKPKAPKLISID